MGKKEYFAAKSVRGEGFLKYLAEVRMQLIALQGSWVSTLTVMSEPCDGILKIS